jgi:hypothetical protein
VSSSPFIVNPSACSVGIVFFRDVSRVSSVGELVGEEVVGERVGFAVFFNLRVLGRTSTVPMPFNKLEDV